MLRYLLITIMLVSTACCADAGWLFGRSYRSQCGPKGCGVQIRVHAHPPLFRPFRVLRGPARVQVLPDVVVPTPVPVPVPTPDVVIPPPAPFGSADGETMCGGSL